MEGFRTLTIVLFGFIISMAIGIFVMIHGWGIEPKSWWWIIGGGILARFIVEVMMAFGRHKKEDNDRISS